MLTVRHLRKDHREVVAFRNLTCRNIATTKEWPRAIADDGDHFRSRDSRESQAKGIHQLTRSPRRRKKQVGACTRQHASAHRMPYHCVAARIAECDRIGRRTAGKTSDVWLARCVLVQSLARKNRPDRLEASFYDEASCSICIDAGVTRHW